MGLLSSLYTGVTGMSAQGEALSIYGDNLANASTTGFKTSRPEFTDVIAKSLKGLLGGNQIGKGSKLTSVNPVFSQGSVVQTESSTDLAIQGDGFLVLKGAEGQSYSRNGALHFDSQGKLINADGYKVQGFLADEVGKISPKMGDISVDRTVVDANGSKKVELFMNLDVRIDPKTKTFDPLDPYKTSHFATGVTVYDTAGTPHVITVFFNKVENGSWNWAAMAKGEDVVGGQKGTMVQQASGSLQFDTDGKLNTQALAESAFNFIGAAQGQKIDFVFGSDKMSGGTGVQVTQFGVDSEVYKTIQDGYSAGTLSGLTFNDDGSLTAVYSNGQNINLAQVALAKFENPEGLFKMGGNRMRESRLSGQPTIGAPGTGGRGTILPKSLESSTTDIASEFINLMTAQRNFQANSRVISAADEMLSEVLNLNRR